MATIDQLAADFAKFQADFAGLVAGQAQFETIAVINQSTVLSDANILPAVAAIQTQILRDFGKFWAYARLVFYPGSQAATIPATYWQVAITDNSDVAGALGYHDITASGQPLGKVFAETTIQAGLNWSVTLSHEILEMLGDPNVNLAAEMDDAQGNPTIFRSYETGDPVEDDSLGYLINGVLVSNFVYPSWFEPSGQPPYDFQRKVTAPFQLLPGGYIGELNITSSSGWTQVQAEESPAMPNIRSLQRLALRNKPRSQWKRSTV